MATMVNNSTPAVLRELDESKSVICMENLLPLWDSSPNSTILSVQALTESGS